MAPSKKTKKGSTPVKDAKTSIGENKDICPDCQNHVKKSQRGLICEAKGCDQWYHAQCVNIETEEYNYLTKQKNVKWYCNNCINRDETSDPLYDKLSSQMSQMMGFMSDLMKRLEIMEGKKSSCDTKMVEEMVDAKIAEAMEESKERESRSQNLVFVNIKENNGTEEEAETKDLEEINKIIQKILPEKDLEDLQIQQPTRLGKKNIGSKPRMLRVTVSSDKAKWNILKNANKINEGTKKAPKDRIYVNPDYTPKQRDNNRKLRDELKERTKNGETDLMIKGEKIVKKKTTEESV